MSILTHFCSIKVLDPVKQRHELITLRDVKPLYSDSPRVALHGLYSTVALLYLQWLYSTLTHLLLLIKIAKTIKERAK